MFKNSEWVIEIDNFKINYLNNNIRNLSKKVFSSYFILLNNNCKMTSILNKVFLLSIFEST